MRGAGLLAACVRVRRRAHGRDSEKTTAGRPRKGGSGGSGGHIGAFACSDAAGQWRGTHREERA
jgi:hypothetical protein